jgi:hypothetical protein
LILDFGHSPGFSGAELIPALRRLQSAGVHPAAKELMEVQIAVDLRFDLEGWG